jgi:hypothetical protein
MICQVQNNTSEIQSAIYESAVAITQLQEEISKIMDAILEIQDIPSSTSLAQLQWDYYF